MYGTAVFFNGMEMSPVIGAGEVVRVLFFLHCTWIQMWQYNLKHHFSNCGDVLITHCGHGSTDTYEEEFSAKVQRKWKKEPKMASEKPRLSTLKSQWLPCQKETSTYTTTYNNYCAFIISPEEAHFWYQCCGSEERLLGWAKLEWWTCVAFKQIVYAFGTGYHCCYSTLAAPLCDNSI